MHLFLGVLAILGIAVVLIALAALAIAKIKSDTKHGTSGTLSSAMLHVHSLLQPDKERMAESIRAEREDENNQSGDPPTP